MKKVIKQSKHCEIFQIVKNGKKYVIVVGQYKAIEREFNTLAETENYIGSKPYKLIFNTFQILQNYAKKQNTSENEEGTKSTN